MPAQTQTRRILIKVDTSDSKGLQDIANKMGALNKNTKSLANNMSFLTNIFTGFLGYLGVREMTRMSDEMQNLSSRLKITAQAGENTATTFTRIAELADRTNQSISSVGDVYNRLAISLSSVNPKTEELIALSEVLINTFRVAGATTTETANTMIQLSQAFSSGELRGQELRSVMEQNGVLAKLLREEFGSDVYKKAEKGLIGITDVMAILSKNQAKILKDAKELAPTFEQTITKAMNKVSVAIGELNDKYKLSAHFADGMVVATDNIGTAMVALAATSIPLLMAAMERLTVAAVAFAGKHPVVAALLAIVVVGTAVYNNWERLIVIFKKFEIATKELATTIVDYLSPALSRLDKYVGTNFIGGAQKLREEAAAIRKELSGISSLKVDTDKDLYAEQRSERALLELKNKLSKNKKPPKESKLKEILGDINKELIAGSINIDEYNKKLVNFEMYKLNREFKEGKTDVFAYNQRLKELNIQELNRKLKFGVLSFGEFTEAVRKQNINELTAKFEAGRISLSEYNAELVKLTDKLEPGAALQSGTAAYIQSIGTLSENIAHGITKTFSHLEDNLVDFVKTGTFNFAKMTEAILDDLTRIIIRASIMKPLGDAILSGFSVATPTTYDGGTGGSVGGGIGASAGAGVKKFASGGIVDSPTMFKYGGGRTGMAGEAGTEAIIPLQRGRNGDLGVAASVTPVTVNIINQSGSTVEQRESTGPGGEKTIDILIMNKVSEGISTGRFDKPMKQAYGLNRRGS